MFDKSPRSRGIGFGVGTEPLPSYFISRGCTIVATDQPPNNDNTKNWTGSDQYTSSKAVLNSRGICNETEFNEQLTLDYLDMNYIPKNYRDGQKFDFVWSSCALEHLGTLQNGLWFILRSLTLLRPGGIAVHTTEYNLSSNDKTNFANLNCIYRKQDLDVLGETVESFGYKMDMVDTTRGTHEYDLYVDGLGWRPYIQEPHLNLRLDGFDVTSVLLTIRKP
jgi:hypothetical protein